ncbi:MAG: hypothetical protein JSR69_08710 [Proteobacteria bacterium]|nr:hypothetical protein [Pseudomonadota bacterium]
MPTDEKDSPDDQRLPVTFNSGAEGYAFDNALFLATLCKVVYESPERIQAAIGGTGWECFFFGSIGGAADAARKTTAELSTQVAVLYRKDAVVVAFRGSEATLEDWAINLSFPHCDGGGGAVHSGFWSALDAVWQKLSDSLSKRSGKAPLWITGHSLGGALAVLMAARLLYDDRPDKSAEPNDWATRIRGVYTFGQPRVGNWLFASNFEDVLGHCCFRFVNNDDVVARVPPPPMGFAHVGRRLYFGRTGVLSDQDRGADLVADRYWQAVRVESSKKLSAITDHSITLYIQGLEKNRDFIPEARSDASMRQVIWSEWQALRLASPKRSSSSAPRQSGYVPPLPALYGLALSGGGIRSATFNLGLLQALASRGLIRKMHYLSTVSGGGYIGAWLSAWMYRIAQSSALPKCCQPFVKPRQRAASRRCVYRIAQASVLPKSPQQIVESRLGGRERAAGGHYNDASEAREVTWLRRFSNYLTPAAGLFSSDTLAAVSIWLRNTLLNQLLLCSAFMFGMLALWGVLGHVETRRGVTDPSFGAYGILTLWVGTLLYSFGVAWTETGALNREGDATRSGMVSKFLGFLWLFLPFVLIDAFPQLGLLKTSNTIIFVSLAPPISLLGAFMVGAILLAFLSRLFNSKVWLRARHKFAGPAKISPGNQKLKVWIQLLRERFDSALSEVALEWWARANGFLLYLTVVWLAFVGLTLWGPFVIQWAWGEVVAAGGIAWIVASAGGVWSAMSAKTGNENNQGLAARLAVIAPYVFVVGLLGLLAFWVYGVLKDNACAGVEVNKGVCENVVKTAAWSYDYKSSSKNGTLAIAVSSIAPAQISCDYGCQVAKLAGVLYVKTVYVGIPFLFIPLACFMLMGFFLGLIVDINRFSLHFLYRNRLERCYPGASNAARRPNRFTGLCQADSPPLYCLKSVRPYPLINAALNMTHQPSPTSTDQLGWQERKSASFLFSPLWCGYRLAYGERGVDAYQRTDCFANITPNCLKVNAGDNSETITLGMAMTISGAAASPNSGYHTRPGTAFLLTLFNARLGWWLQNPRRGDFWRGSRPRFSSWLLLKELLGWSNDLDQFVYVSDGGHFENLGIYELVRRRCAVIIVSDASCDGGFEFEDLGNAIRKCRTDFGVDIDLDPRAIVPNGDGLSEHHCGVGIIRYPETEELPAMRGQILYFKPSLTGDEPADVLQYRNQHSGFPHQTTADQWFDESQFESYRKLGQHIGLEVLAGSHRGANGAGLDVVDLVDRLWRRWHRPHRFVFTAMSRHGERLDAIFGELRSNTSLCGLDNELLTDWNRVVTTKSTVRISPNRDELYFAGKLFQLMEDVFLDLHLMEDSEHPDVQGWINLFRQWSGSPKLRIAWSLFGCTYGQRFRDFCNETVGLPSARPCIVSPHAKAGLNGLGAMAPAWLTGSGERYFLRDINNYAVALGAWSYELLEFEVIIDHGAREQRYPLGYCVIASADNQSPLIVDFSLRPHLRGLGLVRPLVISIKALQGVGARIYYRSQMAGPNAESMYDIFHAEGIYPKAI